MRKTLMILLTLLLLFPFTVNAVSQSDVDYKIKNMYVDAKIDISGNLNIKEVIEVEGTYNGYIRDLLYKNDDLKEFTGELSSFESSDIYNATGVDILKVGSISYDKELDFNIFSEEVKEFSETSANPGDIEKYEVTEMTSGKSIKMFNETKKGVTLFYIEYLVGNVVVKHNDIAEVYYNFIGNEFADKIEKLELRLLLPFTTDEEIRVWAHGPLTGEVALVSEEKEDGTNTYYGAYLKVLDLNPNTPVDMRFTYPKKVFLVDHPYVKKSNVDGLDNIIKVETQRANEANEQREKAKSVLTVVYVISGFYLAGLVLCSIYVFRKYDKEFKSKFKSQYYREFIEDYDVEIIEYLFDTVITDKAFSTSILNLIYKKAIKAEKISDKKENYIFTKQNTDKLSENENIIIRLLFDEIGEGKTVKLSDIKSYAKKTSKTGDNAFLNSYNAWKNSVISEGKKQNFFTNNIKIKLAFALYSLLGFIIVWIHSVVGLFNILTLFIILGSIVFLIYIIIFKKRTEKGNEHYEKWKAFKNFLNDFGRFEEKELPEIILWERYLVYASIFGLADKVSKTMKVKIEELNSSVGINQDMLFNYYLFNSLSRDINRTVHSSYSGAVQAVSAAKIAQSSSSSGGGFGGGFSGGGGFGGGGGGGRGF